MQAGRIVLYTSEPEITKENVIYVLRDAMIEHRQNAQDIQYLMNYDAGIQPLIREKKTRTDMECHCVDNVANEITEFNLGFKWGNPITLVQNGDGAEKTVSEAVSMLNSCYDSAKIKAKTQELGRYIEIGGIGYVYIDANMD